MDILTTDINKFVRQKGIVKDSMVEEYFKDGPLKKHILYDNGILMAINRDTGYLCVWKKDMTIIMYRYDEKCKVCLFNGEEIVKTMYIKTSETISFFTLLMDYHELENILAHNSLTHEKLKDFLF